MKGFSLRNSSIPLDEIKDREGTPKHGIPSIDNPRVISSRRASLADNNRILGDKENGIAKTIL